MANKRGQSGSRPPSHHSGGGRARKAHGRTPTWLLLVGAVVVIAVAGWLLWQRTNVGPTQDKRTETKQNTTHGTAKPSTPDAPPNQATKPGQDPGTATGAAPAGLRQTAAGGASSSPVAGSAHTAGSTPLTPTPAEKDKPGDKPWPDWLSLLLTVFAAFVGGFLGKRTAAKAAGGDRGAPSRAPMETERPIPYGPPAPSREPLQESAAAVRQMEDQLKKLAGLPNTVSTLASSVDAVRKWVAEREEELKGLRRDLEERDRRQKVANNRYEKAVQARVRAEADVRDRESDLQRAKSEVDRLQGELDRTRTELTQKQEELGAADLGSLVLHVEEAAKKQGVPHPEALEKLRELGNEIVDGQFAGTERQLALLDSYVYALPRELALAMHGGQLEDQDVRQVVMLQHQIAKHLEKQGLTLISPKSGDDYNRERHEYSEDELVPHSDRNMDGRVHDTKRLGYVLQGRVLRKAHVRRYIAR